jgi:hypothetical protein
MTTGGSLADGLAVLARSDSNATISWKVRTIKGLAAHALGLDPRGRYRSSQ